MREDTQGKAKAAVDPGAGGPQLLQFIALVSALLRGGSRLGYRKIYHLLSVKEVAYRGVAPRSQPRAKGAGGVPGCV